MLIAPCRDHHVTHNSLLVKTSCGVDCKKVI